MSKEHCKNRNYEQNDHINTDQICKTLNKIVNEILQNKEILSNRDITLTKLIQKQGNILEKLSEKSDISHIVETQKEILKILTQNKTERSLNCCLERIQDLISLDIDRKLKNLENKLDFLSTKQESPILREVLKKVDCVLINQINCPTTEYDPDKPKPLEIETKNLAEQLLKVQSETIPLIEQIKPILEAIKKKL